MSITNGDAANISEITFGVHTGTHVDAPSHFIEGGPAIAEIDPAKLIGPCRVVSISPEVIEIGPEHLIDLQGFERILFKTRNSELWKHPDDGFRKDFTHLTPPAARILASAGIRLVGIDYLSIEKAGAEGHPVHKALLEKGIVILEGLDLRSVEPGDYELICLPLKYIGGKGDGSPARTLLIRRD